MVRWVRAIDARLGAMLLFAAIASGLALQVTRASTAPAATAAIVRSVPPARPLARNPPAPLDQRLVVKRILDVPTPFRHGDYVWMGRSSSQST